MGGGMSVNGSTSSTEIKKIQTDGLGASSAESTLAANMDESVFGSIKIGGGNDSTASSQAAADAEKARFEAERQAKIEEEKKKALEEKEKAEEEIRRQREAPPPKPKSTPPVNTATPGTITTNKAKSASSVKKPQAVKPSVTQGTTGSTPGATTRQLYAGTPPSKDFSGNEDGFGKGPSRVPGEDIETKATAKMVAGNDGIEGNFTIGVRSFDAGEVEAFQSLNIKEGDAASKPLREVHGLKIFSTDPDVKPEDIKFRETSGYGTTLELPNGQILTVPDENDNDNSDARFIFNGTTSALVNASGCFVKGNSEQKDQIISIGSIGGGIDTGGYDSTQKDAVVLVDSVIPTLNANDGDIVVAAEGSAGLRGTSSEGVEKFAGEGSFVKKGSNATFSEAMTQINEQSTEIQHITGDGKLESAGASYVFKYGEKDISAEASMSTSSGIKAKAQIDDPRGSFNTDMEAFKDLNIEKSSPQSTPLVEVGNVKVLCSDPNINPKDIKVEQSPIGVTKFTLPDGQQITITDPYHQKENSQIVFDGKKVALCGLKGFNFAGSKGENGSVDDQVVAIDCGQGVFDANDLGTSTEDNFVFVNSKLIKVITRGDDHVVGLGNSGGITVEGEFSGKSQSQTATDASSQILVSMGRNQYQRGYMADELLGRINLHHRKK